MANYNPGERGFNNHKIPDCSNNGTHRYGMIHFLPSDKSFMLQSCRRCGERKITQVSVINGKLVEKVVKASTLDETMDK